MRIMTEQEVKRQLEACEQHVMEGHQKLISDAKQVGEAARITAASKAALGAAIQFVIFAVFAVILFVMHHPIFGVLCLIGGGIVAYNVHESSAKIERVVTKRQEQLNNVLKNNRI